MRWRAMLPPLVRRAPRSATAARRSHRPGRPGRVARPRVRGRCCDRMGSRRAGPAAATPPPMTTRLTPSVRASDRIARARWSATRSMISTATSSPAALARKTSAAVDRGDKDGAATGSDRLVGLATDRRTGGDRLEAAAQTAGADGAVRIGDDVAHLAGEVVVAAEQGPVEDDAGRDAGPDRQEGDARRRLSRPVGRLRRSARAPPRGRRARRRPGRPAPPAASVPAAGG